MNENLHQTIAMTQNQPLFWLFFKDNEGVMIDTYTPVNGGKTQIALFMGDTDE